MPNQGSQTVALAAASAILLSESLSSDEVRDLGVFLSLVGHNLQVISAAQTLERIQGILEPQGMNALPELP